VIMGGSSIPRVVASGSNTRSRPRNEIWREYAKFLDRRKCRTHASRCSEFHNYFDGHTTTSPRTTCALCQVGKTVPADM
jgi:hypothetical protein